MKEYLEAGSLSRYNQPIRKGGEKMLGTVLDITGIVLNIAVIVLILKLRNDK